MWLGVPRVRRGRKKERPVQVIISGRGRRGRASQNQCGNQKSLHGENGGLASLVYRATDTKLKRQVAIKIYYVAPDGHLMAAPITVRGGAVEPGTPVSLFPTRIFGGGLDNQQGWQFDVARDGRFLVNSVVDSRASPITLIQNWTPPAKK